MSTERSMPPCAYCERPHEQHGSLGLCPADAPNRHPLGYQMQRNEPWRCAGADERCGTAALCSYGDTPPEGSECVEQHRLVKTMIAPPAASITSDHVRQQQLCPDCNGKGHGPCQRCGGVGRIVRQEANEQLPPHEQVVAQDFSEVERRVKCHGTAARCVDAHGDRQEALPPTTNIPVGPLSLALIEALETWGEGQRAAERARIVGIIEAEIRNHGMDYDQRVRLMAAIQLGGDDA